MTQFVPLKSYFVTSTTDNRINHKVERFDVVKIIKLHVFYICQEQYKRNKINYIWDRYKARQNVMVTNTESSIAWFRHTPDNTYTDMVVLHGTKKLECFIKWLKELHKQVYRINERVHKWAKSELGLTAKANN